MVRDGMVRRTGTKAHNRADKEAAKGYNVCIRGRIFPKHVDGNGYEEKEKGAEEMAVDIHGFVVQVK